jgi:tripartite-type tricarboxylate transporter receptor subunit TctC
MIRPIVPALRHAALALILALPAALANAQAGYPTKPLRLIIPFPAGGGPDVIMRRASNDLQQRIGQGFVIDNRGGGNFVIGAEACARAAPDGYTVCHVNSTQFSVNPHVMAKLSYDVEKDFRPITNLYNLVSGLFVSAALPPNSMKEFEAYAKARPGQINMSTHGNNTPTDIYRQWLNDRWGTNLTGIGYKDGTAMIAALLAGDVHFVWIGFFNALGQIQAKKVKMIAISTTKRYPTFPDVPSFGEIGFTDAPLTSWQGFAAPGGTPDAVIRRLNGEIVRIFREPAFAEFLVTQGVETMVGTPEEFAEFMRKDRAYAGEIVKRFNIPKQ